jgi:hypothetical protein
MLTITTTGIMVLIAIIHPSEVNAMDWQTATQVALCRNRPGYEKKAERIETLLKQQNIKTVIIYFVHVNGIRAVTEEKGHAEEFGAFVNMKNADAARKILRAAIQGGLDVTLLPSSRISAGSR